MRFREDDWQLYILSGFVRQKPDAVLEMSFDDGEFYRCSCIGFGEDDNAIEVEEKIGVEIDTGDPMYEDYFQAFFELSEDSPRGGRNYHQFLTIDRRDFPSEIIDVDTGTVVYPPGDAEQSND